jgi:NTE family protein
MWFFGFGGDRGVERLRAYIEREVIRLPLSQMPERPSFIFGATDAVFAARWTFEKTRVGDYQVGYVSPPPEEWTVARAVAASIALQPFFGAMRFRLHPDQLTGGKYMGEDRDKLISKIKLFNGLHYDHLAVEPVWRQHEVVLVSDGGSRVRPSPVVRGFLQDIARFMDISYAQNDAMRKGWLLSNFASNILQGTYWSVTRNVREYEPGAGTGYSQAFVERYLSSLRSDLIRIEPEELRVLENHGYLMADVGMRRRDASFFEARKADLALPFPELMDEKIAATAFDMLHFG